MAIDVFPTIDHDLVYPQKRRTGRIMDMLNISPQNNITQYSNTHANTDNKRWINPSQSRRGGWNESTDVFRAFHTERTLFFFLIFCYHTGRRSTYTHTHTHTHTEVISRGVREQKRMRSRWFHAGNHDVLETYHLRYMALWRGWLERDRKWQKQDL